MNLNNNQIDGMQRNNPLNGSNNILDKFHLPNTILLVEDDRAHAQLITRALKGLAVNVTHVSNVNEALIHLSQNNTDLILTDLNLVTSTGFELLDILKNSDSSIPVIVLTSSANLDDAVRSMREGAWDYLTKQFTSNFSSHLEIVLSRNWERAIQKRREIEAQAERNAFWMASSLADDGLAILNSQGEILYHNEAFFTFLKDLGATNSDEPLELVSLISKFDFQLSQDLFTQIHISDDSIWRSELGFERKIDNYKKYYELRLSTVLDNGNKIQNNFSNNIQNENKFRYHVIWVKDLTKIRQSEQFERDLLATTTHDLKGPLGAILTSTELVLEEGASNFIEDMIVKVASCARTCVSLVDGLLSARKLQDGIMEISQEWIDLMEPITEVFSDYEAVAKSKNINYTILKGSTTVPVYADSLAIRRIAANLIGNALKFTQRGGDVTVEIDKIKNGAVIKVSDNGAGISPEKQAKLFEMFGRLPEHGKVEGTGLGLYIAKKLVDMHGANLDLKSSPGVGTTFIIRFKNPAQY